MNLAEKALKVFMDEEEMEKTRVVGGALERRLGHDLELREAAAALAHAR